MSYEGHELWCCVNGHISHYDALLAPPDEENWECPHCNAKVFDVGYVDETNGLPYPINFLIKELSSSTSNELPKRYSFIRFDYTFYRNSPIISEWENADEIARKCVDNYLW